MTTAMTSATSSVTTGAAVRAAAAEASPAAAMSSTSTPSTPPTSTRTASAAPAAAPESPTHRLRPVGCGGSGTLRLVVFPHAGGTVGFYRPFGQMFPPSVDVRVVQYPGREARYGEPSPADLHVLADEAAEALEPLADVPLTLFGHNLGGRVAYEVATRLESRGVPVERLFVSGCPAPDTGVLSRMHELEDTELIAALRTVGGTLPMLLDDPELHEYLLPTVRADYRLLELYRPSVAPALRTGVVAFSGRDDQIVGSGPVEAWRLVTDGAFRQRMFPGDHFYLINHATALISAVLETLAWEPELL